MSKKNGWTKEEFEQMRKEMERRYTLLDKKEIEHRGYRGHATQIYDNDSHTFEWCGKELSTNHRFYGNTLDEAEADFHSLIDGMIELGMLEDKHE